MTKKYDNIYDAVRYVQNNAPIIGKEKDNPFFKSKYADLPTIWRAIKSTMDEAGLSVITCSDFDEVGNEYIETQIHGHGSMIKSRSFIMLGKRTAQEYGSFITYIRRYHISSMLGLQVDEDDDGNRASERPVVAPKATKQVTISPHTIDDTTINKMVGFIKGIETVEGYEEFKESEAMPIYKQANKEQQQLLAAAMKQKLQELET